jgi:hypothetical protein
VARGVRRLVGAIAAVVALAACGSSSHRNTVSARSYVNSVCSAVNAFAADVTARAKAVAPAVVTAGSATQRKAALQQYVGAVIADTRAALTRVRAAGTPQISNGATVAATLVDAFKQVEATYTRAGRQVAALPTHSVSGFESGVASIVEGVNSSDADISKRVSAIRNTASLRAAAKKSPACQQARR